MESSVLGRSCLLSLRFSVAGQIIIEASKAIQLLAAPALISPVDSAALMAPLARRTGRCFKLRAGVTAQLRRNHPCRARPLREAALALSVDLGARCDGVTLLNVDWRQAQVANQNHCGRLAWWEEA